MNDLRKILDFLVSIPTVTGNFAANNKALDYVADFLDERGMHVVRRQHDEYGALVATSRPTKTPIVMLVAHLDVVTADDEAFTLGEKDGKLLGRGVFDMKGALAAYMALVDRMGASVSDFDFGIMVTTDEETRDFGVRLLLEEGFMSEVAVLPDGGDDWQLEASTKGTFYKNISVQGRSSHGSRPWLGECATTKVLELLNEIRALFPHPGPETNTLNIGIINAGRAVNQIPDLAEVALDVRTMNQFEYDRINQEIDALCKKYDAHVATSASFVPLVHDMANPYMKTFATSIRAVTGKEAGATISFGASDAVHYLDRNIPCVVTRPPGGDHHTPTEWIDKKALGQLVYVLQDFLERTCKIADGVAVAPAEIPAAKTK